MFDSVTDMPFECYHQIRLDYRDIECNMGAYDYLAAVQGNVNAVLPDCVPHLEKLAYTLKSTGVAYWEARPNRKSRAVSHTN